MGECQKKTVVVYTVQLPNDHFIISAKVNVVNIGVD